MSVYSEVKRAYNEKTRNLHFLASRPIKASSLLSVVKVIGQYNEFRPARVATAISMVDPNASVYVGREGSVVLYIKTTTGRRSRMRAALKDVRADEIDTASRGYIRAWWD